ncbi:paralemmin-2 isoform X4, partial [Silurus asotus]
MEEADLLRERLQAITEKRRIQEDIATKRREIEEEKLKLQYLKKKALREQWLMDGLSSQNEQEEEAMRAQAQEEQQQNMLLQQQILRIEDEFSMSERKKMLTSTAVRYLKRRVEKSPRVTAEELRKDLSDVGTEVSAQTIRRTLVMKASMPELPGAPPCCPRRIRRVDCSMPKVILFSPAMYAMEISVEKNLRTGECHVLSTATVNSQKFQEEGIKVYDDGRKSVYALQSPGKESEDAPDHLSPLDVKELLRKATVKKDQADVQYHEPVFSSPYSRSCTPQKVERGIVSPGPNGIHIQSKTFSTLQPDNQICQLQDPKKIHSYIPDHEDFHINKNAVKRQNANITKGCGGVHMNNAEPMQELKEQNLPIPLFDSQLGYKKHSSFHPREDACCYAENSFSSNVDSSAPVTMIFMGFKNAEPDEGDSAIQAELVVIDNDEEDNDKEPPLSYHPQGYHSKVFQPKNDNLYRSEVRHSFIKSQMSRGHLMQYGTQKTDTSGIFK